MQRTIQSLFRYALPCLLSVLLGGCSILIPAKRVMPPEQGMTFHTVGTSQAPTVVLLSGCGGVKPDTTPHMVRQLNGSGFNAVVLDYVRIMGLEQACLGQIRPDRFLALLTESLAYIAQQPSVDRDHVALLGWSLGASAALTYARIVETEDRPPISAVVAYYPGCYDGLELSSYPTLMLVGMADNVVDPDACLALAKRSPQTPLVVKTFANAQHNFDDPRFKQPQKMHFLWKTVSSAYSAPATEEAERATLQFLKENNR